MVSAPLTDPVVCRYNHIMPDLTGTDPASIPRPEDRGYADASVLVTTDWLAANFNDPNLIVVDTDDPAVYAAGHIPGASNPPDNYYKTSLEDRTHIQGPEQFAETMQSLSIGDDSVVVAYDRTGGLYALRLMWSLLYYGHANAKMLDGGYQKWIAEGRDSSTDPYMAPPGVKFTPSQPDSSIFAGRSDVIAAIDDGETTLLDVRSDAEWDGRNKRGGKRGGRVPGAKHLEWTNFHTGGDIPVLKPAGEIDRLLAETGIDKGRPIITYCQGGIRAAHAFWVAKLVGASDVRNYDASWREWGNDPDTQIESET